MGFLPIRVHAGSYIYKLQIVIEGDCEEGGGGVHVLNNDCGFQNDASYEIEVPSEVSFTAPKQNFSSVHVGLYSRVCVF